MSPIPPKNIDMHFDRTAGQEDLEMSPLISARRFRDDSTGAVLMAEAAICAVHGCCDGEWAVEEYERWDGMA